MIDKSDLITISFYFGCLFGICLMFLINSIDANSRYKKLLRYTKSLIDTQEGIISVADLSLKAEVSPKKASRFLKKLALQLEIEPQVDDTGAIYYVFNTVKVISNEHQLGQSL